MRGILAIIKEQVDRLRKIYLIDLGFCIYERYRKHSVAITAAGVTYYFVFALFPLLLSLNALAGFFRLDNNTTMWLEKYIPQDIVKIITSYVDYVGNAASAPILYFGFIFYAYIQFRAISYIIDVLCMAYDSKDTRPIWSKILIVVSLGVGVIVSIIISLLINVVGDSLVMLLTSFFEISSNILTYLSIYKLILVPIILFSVLMLIYTLAPNVVMRPFDALPGTVTTLTCWTVASRIFALYIDSQSSGSVYSVVYGSIGAVMILLIWLYFIFVTLILGAELNAELRSRRGYTARIRRR